MPPFFLLYWILLQFKGKYVFASLKALMHSSVTLGPNFQMGTAFVSEITSLRAFRDLHCKKLSSQALSDTSPTSTSYQHQVALQIEAILELLDLFIRNT